VVTRKRSARTAVLAATIVASLSVVLVGCSSSSNSSSGTDKKLTIGMQAANVAAFEGYVKDFEKTHKGWDITVKAVPDAPADYVQQLVTQGLSNKVPDIVFDYDNLNATLASNHLLYNIKPWFSSGKDGLKESNFQANFLGQYKVGSQITGIPVSADSIILEYSANVFQKYGVTPPSASWTYADMYKAAQEITKNSGGKVYGIQTPLQDGSSYAVFEPILKAYGSNVYDPTTKKFVFANAAGIQAWTRMLAPYTQKFGTPYVQGTQKAWFEAGQAAMDATSTASVTGDMAAVKGTGYNVVQLPQINGKSTIGGGSYALAISSKSTNKAGAWEFMSWFYSANGGMKAAAPNGVIPPTKTGLATSAWKEAQKEPSNRVATVEYSTKNAVLPASIPDSIQPKVVPALQEAMQKVILQGASVQQAYTAAQDELNGQLGQ
jgi:multiple sugar transport system substrate-binding protein